LPAPTLSKEGSAPLKADPLPHSGLAIPGVSSIVKRGRLGPLIRQGEKMKNPLDSLWGTVISGLVLTLILYWVVKLALGS
jgi:hypothetical protein